MYAITPELNSPIMEQKRQNSTVRAVQHPESLQRGTHQSQQLHACCKLHLRDECEVCCEYSLRRHRESSVNGVEQQSDVTLAKTNN